MREFKSHNPTSIGVKLSGARRAPPKPPSADQLARAAEQKQQERQRQRPPELGGPSGPEPTRYGDWERKGICVDF